MTEIAERVRAHAPDVLVVISPHGQRHTQRWGVCTGRNLRGSFARFGAEQARVSLPGAPDAANRLLTLGSTLSLELAEIEEAELDYDHGALVPLYFVQRAGFEGPTLIITPPARRAHTHEQVGQAIARAAAEAGERWVVLASGDMSHRLIPGAPSGYDPRAVQFDAGFRACIDRGALREACTTDPALRELAAEDVVDSVAVAAAAVDYRSEGHHIVSYEGPFGVGYLEAVLFDAAFARAASNEAEPPWGLLLKVARQAIEHRLSGAAPAQRITLPDPWREPRGVFVTLRRRNGGLRGCVGHIAPQQTLVDAVADCAIAAAERDTRFRPVSARELAGLRIEISLLSTPEPISDHALLDPKRYGVIVSCGSARGVLLPDVDGVITVADQLRIAADKAGLPPDRACEIERFEVLKGAEELPLTSMRRGDA